MIKHIENIKGTDFERIITDYCDGYELSIWDSWYDGQKDNRIFVSDDNYYIFYIRHKFGTDDYEGYFANKYHLQTVCTMFDEDRYSDRDKVGTLYKQILNYLTIFE